MTWRAVTGLWLRSARFGDLRAELTVLGRCALAEFDSGADLLRIVVAEARATWVEMVHTQIVT